MRASRSKYNTANRRNKPRRRFPLRFFSVTAVLALCATSAILYARSSSVKTLPSVPVNTSVLFSEASLPEASSEASVESFGHMNLNAESSDSQRKTAEFVTPVLETASDLLEHRAKTQLKRLSQYFTDGSYWNHIDIDISEMSDEDRAMCVTDTPCTHSVNGYDYCNIYNGVMAEYFPQYDYETQCLGYASLISDLIFGLDAPVIEFYNFDDLHIGDHIRLVYNEHSMIVTNIDWETDTVTVTEVNADYESCEISWNRQITRDELYALESDVRFYTRYVD